MSDKPSDPRAGEEGAVAVTGPRVLRCASVLGLVEGDCDRVVPVEGLGLAVADPAVGADRVGGLNVPRHPRARVGERVPAACRVVAALEIDQDVVPPRYEEPTRGAVETLVVLVLGAVRDGDELQRVAGGHADLEVGDLADHGYRTGGRVDADVQRGGVAADDAGRAVERRQVGRPGVTLITLG